ncbi:IS630 family transposase [Streptomyces sp. NTH33]|uniref:IS630 family transposase n=1 Tax=Streptomyces sp. NTH33 TaxID=1735453 RepID=UPI000DAA0CBE|nr:IS630 family transposase [Streptomyces sp. NTH33]PZH18092.1 IS630 family transposase [Streptomyces sp. NTH33]
MRPASVFANSSGPAYQHLYHLLHHRWREAARTVMVLLSAAGLTAGEIGELLGCHPATVRRWIHRYHADGPAALADRLRSGRPRAGGPHLGERIRRLLTRPGPWTVRRIRRRLGQPKISPRTVYRRTREQAAWRRPRLTARGDPNRRRTLAALHRQLRALPGGSVVLAEDETHLHLLSHIRASWIPRGTRQQVATPGKNRQATLFGALEMTTGTWHYTLRRRTAAAFTAFLQTLLAAHPTAPAVAVLCDDDSIHHAKAVTAYLADHPRIRLLFGARYSPHDNPVERIWAALKAHLANTAVTWPGRRRQAHAFFRQRSPTQMLTTAAPWASPWLPRNYAQNFRTSA